MIYFVRCGKDGPVKIGYTSTNLAARLIFLQVGCPWELQVLGTMDGDLAAEAGLHATFDHLHLRGEWFHPASDLLNFIAASTDEAQPRTTATVLPWPAAPAADEDWQGIVNEIMALRGWSQTRLADQLGTGQSIVSKWASGEHNPTSSARASLRAVLAEARAA